MKKGFTLIELLAVIVVLAIIALIVTPVISKIIESAKKRTAVTSVQSYADSVNNMYALSMIDTSYNYLKEKNVLETGFDDNELSEIEVNGKAPSYIRIEYDKSKNRVKEGKFCVDGTSVDYINGVAKESENDYCHKEIVPGLYDKDNNLLFSWDELENDYGLDLNWSYANDSVYYRINLKNTNPAYYVSPDTVYDKFYYQDSNYNKIYVEPDDINDSSKPNIILSKSVFDAGKKLVVSNKIGEIRPNTFSYFPRDWDIIIPAGITKIGANAFAYSYITSFIIGPDVERIDSEALINTHKLKKLIIPDTVLDIGNFDGNSTEDYRYGILGNSAVEKVILSNNIKYIPDAFCRGCKNLKSIDIPANVKKLGMYPFENSGLGSITLHEGLEKMGQDAFAYTYSLKSVSIPNSVTEMGEYSFYYSGLEELTLGTGLTEIPESAFYMTKLKSVNIPSNIKKIGDTAFYNVQAVTIDLGSVEEIGNYAFAFADNLEEVTIPSTVKTLGQSVFTGRTYSDKAAPLKKIIFESLNYWTKSNNCTSYDVSNSTKLASDLVTGGKTLPALRHWNSLSECQ